MPKPRVKFWLIATHPYSAMLDACAVITALLKRLETISNLPWAIANLISFLINTCQTSFKTNNKFSENCIDLLLESQKERNCTRLFFEQP